MPMEKSKVEKFQKIGEMKDDSPNKSNLHPARYTQHMRALAVHLKEETELALDYKDGNITKEEY